MVEYKTSISLRSLLMELFKNNGRLMYEATGFPLFVNQNSKIKDLVMRTTTVITYRPHNSPVSSCWSLHGSDLFIQTGLYQVIIMTDGKKWHFWLDTLTDYGLMSHPCGKLSLDFGHFPGCVLLLVTVQLNRRSPAFLLSFSGMFPTCIDHHAAHQQAGADPVVTGQVDGQQSSQTFPERPEDGDSADPLRFVLLSLGRTRCILLGDVAVWTLGFLRVTRLGFFALHSGLLKLRHTLLSYRLMKKIK